MIRSRHAARRLLRPARFALVVFVATVCVTLLAPFLEATGYELVCSAQGKKRVAHDDGAGTGEHADHAAHCPSCMPAGAPPVAVAWDGATAQPLAHVQQGMPAARLAGLVGAPLPARGPPAVS